MASVNIYKNNPDILPDAKLVHSFWHRGFVHVLFNLEFCPYANNVWKWIKLIGNKYDPNIITNLGGPYDPEMGDCNDLYVKGFLCEDIKNLCDYCHKLFKVNKYETAKLFTTRNPEECDINNKNVSTRAYALTVVAAIYAERNDVESARMYYQKSITESEGENWQFRYIKKFEEFEEYVKKYGTSILSTQF